MNNKPPAPHPTIAWPGSAVLVIDDDPAMPRIIERYLALQPVQVDISLLGATEATFDAVAGSARTLSRVVRGVRLLRERGVPVKLNTLLLNLNLAERMQMLDLARQLGVEYEQVVKISADDDGRDKAGMHQLSTQQIAGVMVEYGSPFEPLVRTAETRTCQVGLSSCVINPYGEVFPCIELRISAGRLVGESRQRFREIWAEAPIFRELRSRHSYANLAECRVCPINAYCESRCAGLAWKRDGDLYGADIIACQQAQARYQQMHPGQIAPQTPLQARRAGRTNGHEAAAEPTTQRA